MQPRRPVPMLNGLKAKRVVPVRCGARDGSRLNVVRKALRKIRIAAMSRLAMTEVEDVVKAFGELLCILAAVKLLA